MNGILVWFLISLVGWIWATWVYNGLTTRGGFNAPVIPLLLSILLVVLI